MLIDPFCVAPLVGAWIEMSARWMQLSADRVAPLMGAWIEIYIWV